MTKHTLTAQQVKKQLKQTVESYLRQDEYGRYVLPRKSQRPVILMGAPGIGKTDIVTQVAQELELPMVSYSMTHHTRQSALGLPLQETMTHRGEIFTICRYTMSEIIASVYDAMKSSGKEQGILFLDEINCASDTLYPAILQFLQNKVFGAHKLPEGWVIVAAGNPKEFNKSAKDFDTVTWDRLKRIDMVSDYTSWKKYAIEHETHPAIIAFLDIYSDLFYKIESSVDGKQFVTARGWSDLSLSITLYEKIGFTVDENLVSQFVQHPEIARKFTVYYELFKKYHSDFDVENIVAGKVKDEILRRAKQSSFGEKLSLVTLLRESVIKEIRNVNREESVWRLLLEELRTIKVAMASGGVAEEELQKAIQRLEKVRNKKQQIGLDKQEEESLLNGTAILQDWKLQLETQNIPDDEAFQFMKNIFDVNVKKIKDQAKVTVNQLKNVFQFITDAFGDGQELMIFMTDLTMSSAATSFISHYGCEEYYKYNERLLFGQEQEKIMAQIEELKI